MISENRNVSKKYKKESVNNKLKSALWMDPFSSLQWSLQHWRNKKTVHTNLRTLNSNLFFYISRAGSRVSLSTFGRPDVVDFKDHLD